MKDNMEETELEETISKYPEVNGLQIIPLGGLGEIGKNMMAIRYEDDIIVVDTGLGFPSEEHYGVDYTLPNYEYLIENQTLVKGVILTHGHEDHIGGINDFLKHFDTDLPPVYGTKLTLGLVEDKLTFKRLMGNVSLRIIQPRHKVQLGHFKVEFLKVCHSIADCIGLAIETPVGTLVHTGDFKFDPTPIDGITTDYFKFAELGEKGVLVLMSDSTNVTRPGFTPSEREVAPALINAIGTATGRVVVTTFASNIHRVQQILNISTRFNRKVALVGRSMERVTKKAISLGYINCSDTVFIKQGEIQNYPESEITILTTGSQGEPMSVLSRIAKGEHKIDVLPGDTFIISAVPIPGNEKMVFNTINKLFAKGAEVIYESYNQLHVSGHASAEELKLMINLTKPKYFVPIHGESRHLIHHAELAETLNVKGEDIFIMQNGDVLEITSEKAEIVGQVPANKILIDGSGIGHVEEEILRDRHVLSRDGVIFVSVTINGEMKVASEPKLVSKGFIMHEGDKSFYNNGSQYLKEHLEKALDKKEEAETLDITKAVINITSDFAYSVTKRKPIVIPVIHRV